MSFLKNKLLADKKLNVISDLISKALHDETISDECHIQRWARPARYKWLQFYFSDLKNLSAI